MKFIIPITPPGRQTRSKLARGRLVVRCEHRAEARRDHVELRVAEGKRLRVAFDPLEIDARLASRAAAGVEVFRRHVGCDDPRAGQRGADRHVAAAGRDVEHPLAR